MRAKAASLRGFTLVEVATVLAIVAVLTSAAWPSWREQVLRSRRIEAASTLQRLQLAQAGHFARFGRYAASLSPLALGLGAGEISAGGHYRLTLQADGADGYRAVASALAAQADDRACAEIELRVRGAIAEQLPSLRCWRP